MINKYQNTLLIDDDSDDQEIFPEAVKQKVTNAKCIAFSDTANALEELIVKPISPVVRFPHLNMPIMTGQQYLLEIKNNHDAKHIPGIIFSTTSLPGTISLTKKMGHWT